MVAWTAWPPPGGRGAFPLWVPELSITSWLTLLPRDGIKCAVPPAGFAHLCRVLAAPLRAFGCASPVPSSVAFRHEHLCVTQHLGSGGYCDVLRVTASDGVPAALKRPRHGEAGERANLAHERAMLTALPRSPHLPRLVDADGGPSGSVSASVLAGVSALLLRPVGMSLHALALEARDDGAREELAQCATAGVLAALFAAHGRRIEHGDVRVRNVIRVDEADRVAGASGAGNRGTTYVLIDWGNAALHARRGDAIDVAWQVAAARDLFSATTLYDDVLDPPHLYHARPLPSPSLAARRQELIDVIESRATLRDALYSPWWLGPPGAAAMAPARGPARRRHR